MGERIYMKKIYVSLVFVVFFSLVTGLNVNGVHAQGITKILVETEKKEYSAGDTFKIYIKGEKVKDVYGMQFTLNYDPDMIELQGNGFSFPKGYTAWVNEVDKKNGILTNAIIIENPAKEVVEIQEQAVATFKALKDGPVKVTLTNIKLVDQLSQKDITNNTQAIAILNITKAVAPEKPAETTQEPAKPAEAKNGGNTISNSSKEATGLATGGVTNIENNVNDVTKNTTNPPATSTSESSSAENATNTANAPSTGDKASTVIEVAQKGVEEVRTSSETAIADVLGVIIILGFGLFGVEKKYGLKNVKNKIVSKFNKSIEM